ncbi:MAG: hypothetical protein K8R76_10095 [Candidatus Aegiribacteria sp.]|nr:hypothetical protein [Candidatus Aegiribacteria sp.]
MKTLLILSSISILLLAVSCSFFDPRDPEYPNPNDDIPWYQPYAPSTVVLNLSNSFEGRSISMFMACCDSSYMFLADDADIAEYSWDFSNWDYEVEQNTVLNIFAAVEGSGFPDSTKASFIMSTVAEFPDPVAPSDSAEIFRDYEIVAAGSEYCGWDNPARGRVIFLMIEDNYGLWSIKRWSDYRHGDYTEEHYTWGAAKASYR